VWFASERARACVCARPCDRQPTAAAVAEDNARVQVASHYGGAAYRVTRTRTADADIATEKSRRTTDDVERDESVRDRIIRVFNTLYGTATLHTPSGRYTGRWGWGRSYHECVCVGVCVCVCVRARGGGRMGSK